MKIRILFLALIIFAFFIRFYHVTLVPPGLTWDEAALGYNAYSIQQTGRDEYGTFLPLNLKSFGDYKPAIYAYLIIPFLFIFNLSELAVRFPSVLAGTALVVVIFFLTRELFNNQKISLLSALVTAIYPLAIQFSRVAFEANLALFFNCLGLLFFLKSLKKTCFLIPAAIIFGLSLFTYQSSRLFLPILITGLILIYRNEIKINRVSIMSGFIGLLAVNILGYTLFFGHQADRLQAINFFAYTRSVDAIATLAKEDSLNVQSARFQILHGEWFSYVRGLAERYLAYYSPKYLFFSDRYDKDNERLKLPDLGILYYFSIITLPLGMWFFLRKNNKSSRVLFWLLLISPIPAVLSRDLFNILRSLNIIVPWIIFDAAGLYYLLYLAQKMSRKVSILVIVFIFGIISFNFFLFADNYFIHNPHEFSQSWLYGYKQIIQMMPEDLTKYDKVIFTDNYGQPYIYYLFYRKYPPANYQKNASLNQQTVDVGKVLYLDNIEFRHMYWKGELENSNRLFIGAFDNEFSDLPEQNIQASEKWKILGRVYFLDGTPAFEMIETK